MGSEKCFRKSFGISNELFLMLLSCTVRIMEARDTPRPTTNQYTTPSSPKHSIPAECRLKEHEHNERHFDTRCYCCITSLRPEKWVLCCCLSWSAGGGSSVGGRKQRVLLLQPQRLRELVAFSYCHLAYDASISYISSLLSIPSFVVV